MPYPLQRTGAPLQLSSQMFNPSNQPVTWPGGTTHSAFTSDANIATAIADSSGNVTITPNGSVTGNVLVTLASTIPGNTADVYGSFWIHVMDAPLSEKEYSTLTPE